MSTLRCSRYFALLALLLVSEANTQAFYLPNRECTDCDSAVRQPEYKSVVTGPAKAVTPITKTRDGAWMPGNYFKEEPKVSLLSDLITLLFVDAFFFGMYRLCMCGRDIRLCCKVRRRMNYAWRLNFCDIVGKLLHWYCAVLCNLDNQDERRLSRLGEIV